MQSAEEIFGRVLESVHTETSSGIRLDRKALEIVQNESSVEIDYGEVKGVVSLAEYPIQCEFKQVWSVLDREVIAILTRVDSDLNLVKEETTIFNVPGLSGSPPEDSFCSHRLFPERGIEAYELWGYHQDDYPYMALVRNEAQVFLPVGSEYASIQPWMCW